MSVLRVYAETGACLLNTGPESDHSTEVIRRALTGGLRLQYDPEKPLIRCYVQVRRSSAPEQFLFEYEGDDDGGDIFDAFVEDARAEMRKSGWTILEDSSAEFAAIESGARTRPDVDDPEVGLEEAVTLLRDADRPVDFTAKDRTTAIGVVDHLRDEFGDRYSIAISSAGRQGGPASDADLMIIPRGSHTGVTEHTRERLESTRVGELRDDVAALIDELAAGTDDAAEVIVGELERRGIADRIGVTPRPTSASYLDAGLGWLAWSLVVGLSLAAVVALATEAPGPVLALLGREVTVAVPGWLPLRGALIGGPGTDAIRFVSGWLVTVAVVVFGVAGGALVSTGRTVALGSVSLPSIGAVSDGSDASGSDDIATPAAEVDGVLDDIGRIADRDAERDALRSALDGHGVELVPAERATGYAYGVRGVGVAIGVAVSVGAYRYGSSLVRVALAGLEARWTLVMGLLLLSTAAVVVCSVGVGLWLIGRRLRPGRRGSTGGRSTRPADGVSRDRVETLQQRLDDGNLEYLKRNVAKKRLIETLEANHDRTDIARFLGAYDRRTDVWVLSEAQSRLVSSVLSDDGAGADGSAVGSDVGTADGREPAEREPTEREPTEREPTEREPTEREPTEREPAEREGGAGFASGSDGTPDRTSGSEGVTDGPGTTAGNGDGLFDDESTAWAGALEDDPGRAASEDDPGRTEGPDRFPAFRYDDANSGYVRGGVGGDSRPETRWKYRTEHEPLAPAVVEGTVYVVDSEGCVYAVDDDGEERWTTSVDSAIKSSPAVCDDTLYFGSDEGRVYAVGLDGERLWDERIGTPSGPLSRGTAAIITPPAVVDGRVCVGDVEGYVHARDAATGAEEWRVDTGGAIYGKLAARNGKLFVANGDGLLAAHGLDGERRWSSGAGREITTTPVAGEASWYVVDGNGVAHRLDPTQGGAEVDTFATGAGNPVSPTVGDGRVFLGSRTGTVQAVDEDLTERQWQSDTDHEDRILAPFLLDEELLYVPAGRHVYALDPATGERRWRYRLADEVRVQPAYADGSLFVATASRVLALDLDGV